MMLLKQGTAGCHFISRNQRSVDAAQHVSRIPCDARRPALQARRLQELNSRKRSIPVLAGSSTTDASEAKAEPDAEAPVAEEDKAKSEEYSTVMSSKMGASLTYRHELGINFTRVLPDLIVGSCLQTPADVDRLAEEEGVTTVFNLQEDCDMAYFSIDIAAIQARCRERGDIKLVRFPIRDFDPFDLRRRLPKAVSRLSKEHDPSSGGTVYIHCTAGMGRAPATALAYMYWLRGAALDEACADIKARRSCSPKIDAIRSATADLLMGSGPQPVTLSVKRVGEEAKVQIAGLDFGWHAPVDMALSEDGSCWELTRPLLSGTYQFKLVVDGVWCTTADYPTVMDGDNENNTITVLPPNSPPSDAERLRRYLGPGSALTPDEQASLADMLCPWGNVLDGSALHSVGSGSMDEMVVLPLVD